jgi:hypothetical protein
MKEYTFSEELVTAIINILNDTPARISRGVLNSIEKELVKQRESQEEEK